MSRTPLKPFQDAAVESGLLLFAECKRLLDLTPDDLGSWVAAVILVSNYTQASHLCTAHGGNGNCLVKGRKPAGVLARQGEQIEVRKLPRTVNALCREEFPVA